MSITFLGVFIFAAFGISQAGAYYNPYYDYGSYNASNNTNSNTNNSNNNNTNINENRISIRTETARAERHYDNEQPIYYEQQPIYYQTQPQGQVLAEFIEFPDTGAGGIHAMNIPGFLVAAAAVTAGVWYWNRRRAFSRS